MVSFREETYCQSENAHVAFALHGHYSGKPLLNTSPHRVVPHKDIRESPVEKWRAGRGLGREWPRNPTKAKISELCDNMFSCSVTCNFLRYWVRFHLLTSNFRGPFRFVDSVFPREGN